MAITIHTREKFLGDVVVTGDLSRGQLTIDTRSNAERQAERERVAADQAQNRVIVPPAPVIKRKAAPAKQKKPWRWRR